MRVFLCLCSLLCLSVPVEAKGRLFGGCSAAVSRSGCGGGSPAVASYGCGGGQVTIAPAVPMPKAVESEFPLKTSVLVIPPRTTVQTTSFRQSTVTTDTTRRLFARRI